MSASEHSPQTSSQTNGHGNGRVTTPPASAARPRARRIIRNPQRFVRNLAIVLGVILVGFALYQVFLADRPKNFGVVEAGHVYRSGRLTTGALEHVAREYGIRTVIDFGAYDTKDGQAQRIRALDRELGLRRHVLPMKGDGTGDPNHYAAALRILSDEKNHPVLVQCAAGAQRTGVCITLYRNVIGDDPLVEAYEKSFEHRHDPGDNWRFPIYLGKWRDAIEEAYRTGERIEIGPDVPVARGSDY